MGGPFSCAWLIPGEGVCFEIAGSGQKGLPSQITRTWVAYFTIAGLWTEGLGIAQPDHLQIGCLFHDSRCNSIPDGSRSVHPFFDCLAKLLILVSQWGQCTV